MAAAGNSRIRYLQCTQLAMEVCCRSGLLLTITGSDPASFLCYQSVGMWNGEEWKHYPTLLCACIQAAT